METRKVLNVNGDSYNPIKVSVVTGSLNEIENIDTFVSEVSERLSNVCDYEIVIVDDSSTDGTVYRLRSIADKEGHLRALFNSNRKGLLNSNLQGISAARGEYCIVMDCDLQHPPDKIPEIVEKLEMGNDIVICSRYAKGGSVGGRNPIRGVISRVAVFLTKLLVPSTRVSTDPVSGFFGFRRGNEIPSVASFGRYKTLTLLLALEPNAKVCEIPFEFKTRRRGESKIVSDWSFALNFIKELLFLRKKTVDIMKLRSEHIHAMKRENYKVRESINNSQRSR